MNFFVEHFLKDTDLFGKNKMCEQLGVQIFVWRGEIFRPAL